MVNINLTEVVAVIDRSGSMSHLVDETIGGFNGFIEEQRKNKNGQVKITLVQFDDQYQIDYNGIDIDDVKPLDKTTYVPRGMTSLNDAVGKTINTIGDRLSKTNEDERPGQVIFLVITDGQENSSQEFNDPSVVSKMVKHQTDVYNWTFTFLGGGDADFQKQQALNLGFVATNSYNYGVQGNQGTKNLYSNLSKGVSRRRDAAAQGVLLCASAAMLTDEEADEIKQ
jgi:uncharacterized protein YegL